MANLQTRAKARDYILTYHANDPNPLVLVSVLFLVLILAFSLKKNR